MSNIQRRQWHPTPVLLPGKSHGWRSLVGCSPWGRKESDTTERLHFHFSLSCIEEGNGNPLQCSCLENPKDRGAWWAAEMGSHRVGHDWSNLAAAAVSNIKKKRASNFSCVSMCSIYWVKFVNLACLLLWKSQNLPYSETCICSEKEITTKILCLSG